MPNRLQQEIDDLLTKLDTFPPRRSLWSRLKRALSRSAGSIVRAVTDIPFPHLSAGHVLLIAIGVIVIGYLALPEGSDLTRWVVAGAVIAFIAAFVMSLRRHSRPAQKYWRDKPMDMRSPGRLRSWWDRRRRR
jgi:hypothetical protein